MFFGVVWGKLPRIKAKAATLSCSMLEWTPGVGDGQGGLACCDSWGRKESDTTEQLNWTELNWLQLKYCASLEGLRCQGGALGWEEEIRMRAKSLQPCPSLCNPIDHSPPGSSVHGILQARILDQVAISFSRGPSWPRDLTRITCVFCTACGFFTAEPLGKP